MERRTLLFVLVLAGLVFATYVVAQTFDAPIVDEVSTETVLTEGARSGAAAIPVVIETNESEKVKTEKINPNIDTDGDWISDKIEIEIGTNPLKLDTDDDGIDDFNEYYTYPHLLDPNDPTDAEKFLEMIPNVEAKHWEYYDGGVSVNCTTRANRLNEVPKRDPLVQWYADHTEIKWNTALIKNGEYKEGKIIVNGEPFRLDTRDNNHIKEYGTISPAYFFTHGRKGICGDCAIALKTLLELKNYDSVNVHGKKIDSGKGHAWIETFINGQVYVGNGNTLAPRDIFYEQYNWTKTHIGTNPYNPDWYFKELN